MATCLVIFYLFLAIVGAVIIVGIVICVLDVIVFAILRPLTIEEIFACISKDSLMAVERISGSREFQVFCVGICEKNSYYSCKGSEEVVFIRTTKQFWLFSTPVVRNGWLTISFKDGRLVWWERNQVENLLPYTDEHQRFMLHSILAKLQYTVAMDRSRRRIAETEIQLQQGA